MSGEKPDRVPMIFMGFWDEKSMIAQAPKNAIDENTSCYPSDYPLRDSYSSEPRSEESRFKAVRLAKYLGMATIGVGKGGVIPFGHGGPGEIQPVVIERTDTHKILGYEGGHKRIIHYNPHSVHYYDFPVKSEEDLDKLQLPDMKDVRRFQDVAEDCRTFKKYGFVPTGSIQGFFSGLHNSFMDFADTMANLLLEPEFMKRFIEKLALMSLDAVDMFLDRGVEVIDVCDDFGNQDGLLMSPDLVREFFIPWYAELVNRVHSRGAYVHLHSHGNIGSLLPDFAKIGIDIINPFDWAENPDLPGLCRSYGDKIVFCGGSTRDQELMAITDREEIYRRACDLKNHTERGYLFMLNQPSPELDKESFEQNLSLLHTILSEK